MEKGIHGSRAFLFSRGFSERYPVSWGMRISIPGVFHISGILWGVPVGKLFPGNHFTGETHFLWGSSALGSTPITWEGLFLVEGVSDSLGIFFSFRGLSSSFGGRSSHSIRPLSWMGCCISWLFPLCKGGVLWFLGEGLRLKVSMGAIPWGVSSFQGWLVSWGSLFLGALFSGVSNSCLGTCVSWAFPVLQRISSLVFLIAE